MYATHDIEDDDRDLLLEPDFLDVFMCKPGKRRNKIKQPKSQNHADNERSSSMVCGICLNTISERCNPCDLATVPLK